MPYLILAIGLLIGLIALYRFFMRANVAQIKALFLTAGISAVVIAAFFLAVTGRLPAALALGGAMVPVVIGYLRSKGTNEDMSVEAPIAITTREDALKVLGLKDGASKNDIEAAYKKLMQKFHPDHEGSEFLAAQLNQARDVLLGN